MKFSIGDRILLKRTGEEGRIVAFLSKTMTEVEVSEIRFPVYNDEIEHPYLKWFTEGARRTVKKSVADIPAEKPASRVRRLSQGIYLSFIPQFTSGTTDDIIEAFRVHLINETPDNIRFAYEARTLNAGLIFSHQGTLHAFGNVYLHPILLEELNAGPRLHWEAAPAAKSTLLMHGDTLRIRAVQLARYIRGMLEKNEPSFNILLTTDADAGVLPEPPAPGISFGPQSVARPEIILHTRAETVLDLHAKEIGLDAAKLSPPELLEAKIAILKRKLQAALAAGLPRMIVIHGIGGGALRDAIHRVLAEEETVKHFSNHWMGRYSWGATEIIFR